ncbi:MFS transporter [Sesbania bispinosa]|nr:MFS transporter [Sesbania bispinosa]
MTLKNVVEDDMRRGKDMRRKACVEEGTLRNMAAHGARRKGCWLAMAGVWRHKYRR